LVNALAVNQISETLPSKPIPSRVLLSGFEFSGGYRKAFEHPQHIRKPELDEADIFILYGLDDVFGCLTV